MTDIIQFIKNILRANYIPIHFITASMDNPEWPDQGLRIDILGLPASLPHLQAWLAAKSTDVIYFHEDIFQCNYVFLYLPEDGQWMVCGPVLFEPMDNGRFQALADNLNLPAEFHASLKYYYEHIAFFPSRELLKSIFFELGNHIYGTGHFQTGHSADDELEAWHTNYKNYLHIPEDPFLNIQIIEARYEAENALMAAVSNCDEEAALKIISESRSYMPTQRLSDPLRDFKANTITLNTLLRKAAEQAGVHPIHIDSYSGSIIPLTEELSSIELFHNFHKKMVHGYCELIRKYNLKQYSVTVRKALTYIKTDLYADLSLNKLAELLNVNANYLSTLFKKEVGMNFTNYVNKSRIELAQNLLLCTDMPIKSIAQQCGIQDIHYFTRLFKRITGMTPKAYRNEAVHNAHSELLKLRQGGTKQ